MALVLAQASSLLQRVEASSGFCCHGGQCWILAISLPPPPRAAPAPHGRARTGEWAGPSVCLHLHWASACQEAHMFPQENVVPGFKNRLLFYQRERWRQWGWRWMKPPFVVMINAFAENSWVTRMGLLLRWLSGQLHLSSVNHIWQLVTSGYLLPAL